MRLRALVCCSQPTQSRAPTATAAASRLRRTARARALAIAGCVRAIDCWEAAREEAAAEEVVAGLLRSQPAGFGSCCAMTRRCAPRSSRLTWRRRGASPPSTRADGSRSWTQTPLAGGGEEQALEEARAAVQRGTRARRRGCRGGARREASRASRAATSRTVSAAAPPTCCRVPSTSCSAPPTTPVLAPSAPLPSRARRASRCSLASPSRRPSLGWPSRWGLAQPTEAAATEAKLDAALSTAPPTAVLA